MRIIEIIHNQHSASARGNHFSRMQTKRRCQAMATEIAIIVLSSESSGGIIDSHERFFRSEAQPIIDVGRQADLIDDHDCFGLGCQFSWPIP